MIDEIKEHINSFPAYESHYSRRDTSQKYLLADLSINKIYGLYCEKVANPVSSSKFGSVFNSMGIKFKSPGIDTCKSCDLLKAKIDIADPNSNEKDKLISEQQLHHLEDDLAYNSKERDKLLAKNDSFDLQQCLPTPFLQNTLSFYKRQLWTYNLTVHLLHVA